VGIRQVEEWGVCRRDGAGQDNLCLHAGNAIHRETVLTLEIADELAEIGIEHIAHRSLTVRALHALQALAKPPYVIASHAL
jgi:hypothetical protein